MKQNGRQIFDPVRKKRVAATPEEEVRQNLLLYLHDKCNIPYELMSCEYPFIINGNKFRSDIVVFSSLGEPLLIAECKAPAVKIGKETFEQILTYNYKLRVKYLLLTNGTTTWCAKYTPQTNEVSYLSSIPKFDELSK